ncbi:MAG: NAD(P)H-dependent oxidoreductase [Methylotenera sp.]|nr:NAD(P)H-dependent oxidoreductase [Oligoflexia bacterium]
MSKKILILLAHPNLKDSKANRVLADAARGLPGVVVHDLYLLYPDFRIDVKKEQALLVDADLIVYQFPFYWYSSPALFKEWQDKVLEWGFAFGKGGDKLEGKKVFVALTTGGPQEAYQSGGNNQYSIVEFLRPLEQTANFCRMDYRAPFVVPHIQNLSEAELTAQAHRYREVLSSLTEL